MKSTKESQDFIYIEAYVGGDESALAYLLNKYQEKLFTYIQFKVKNTELAEDIFQDTFIKMIQTLKKGNYREEGKFYPWLKMIAHNLIMDYFRKNNRMKMLRATEEYDMINTTLVAEETEPLFEREELKKIKNLIRELPLAQREVALMRLNYEMNFKEIAEKTNVSINTALGRMRYAMLNLQKKMALEEKG